MEEVLKSVEEEGYSVRIAAVCSTTGLSVDDAANALNDLASRYAC